ncbi:uncharacterized protein [Haliotis cracherodii]|uniref:uncharacterized protein isoform X1 n=1 Tax=Haliotis cracherodii TaxID=6455 RepID=UPI0039E76470
MMLRLGLGVALLVLLPLVTQGGQRSLKICPPGKELRKNGQQDWRCKRCQDGYFSKGSPALCKPCRTCKHGYKKKCTRKKNAVCKKLSLKECMQNWLKHQHVIKECRGQMEVFKRLLEKKCKGKKMKKKHCMRKVMKKFFKHEYHTPRSTTGISTTTAATTATTATTLGITHTAYMPYSTMPPLAHDEANYEADAPGTPSPEHEEIDYTTLIASIAGIVCLAIIILPIVVKLEKRRKVKMKMFKDFNVDTHHERTPETNFPSLERSDWNESLQTHTDDTCNEGTAVGMNPVDIPVGEGSRSASVSRQQTRTMTSTSQHDNFTEEQNMTSALDLPQMVSKVYDPEREWQNWSRSLPVSKNRPCLQSALVHQASSDRVLLCQVSGSFNKDKLLARHLDTVSDVDEMPAEVIQKLQNDTPVSFVTPVTIRDEFTSHDTLVQSDRSQTSAVTEDEDYSIDRYSGAASTQRTSPAENCPPNNCNSRKHSIPSIRLDFINNLEYQKYKTVRPENLYGNLFSSRGTQTKRNHENTRTIFGYEWNKSADFTSAGGSLRVRRSDISLHVPRDAVPTGESVSVQAYFTPEFHNLQPYMDDDEVIVSPVGEFQMSYKTTWDRYVRIHIPYIQRNPEETFRVRFFQENTSGNMELGDVPVKVDGVNEDMYYVKKDNHVEIFTIHFTGFFCSVCGHTCPLDLVALVFGCYGQHDHEAWVTLLVGDRRNSIPEVRQKILDKERALNGTELVAERSIRLVEHYDCESRLMFRLHVRTQAQLWSNADSESGDQQVRRLRELIKCSCSKVPDVSQSEFESHHKCEDRLQWVYSCDDPLPHTFSCKIHVEHVLNGDVVTPRHDTCNEGVTNILVPPLKLPRPQQHNQMKSQDADQPMGFGELSSSKKPLFSRNTNTSLMGRLH